MTVDTSYLTTQVNNIVGQLHGLFDDIGIPSHERESRETEASQDVHNNNSKNKLTDLSSYFPLFLRRFTTSYDALMGKISVVEFQHSSLVS